MNVFQSALKQKLVEKKEALMALKKSPQVSSVNVKQSESDETPLQVESVPLDYSTNKILRQMKEFEEERQKKKRKAFKEPKLES